MFTELGTKVFMSTGQLIPNKGHALLCPIFCTSEDETDSLRYTNDPICTGRGKKDS
jgi:hypothetical protein